MIKTLNEQIQAAGGMLLNETASDTPWEIILAVNNFDGPGQLEAADQPSVPVDNGWFEPLLGLIGKQTEKNTTVGFCDNRYANGGDLGLVNFLTRNVSQVITINRLCYAGWNTDGNTIG